jgi:hypothetical protein
MNTSTIVQKLWNYCNVLRDDGMSYGDYVEAAPRQLLPALLYLKKPASKTPWTKKLWIYRQSLPASMPPATLAHPCASCATTNMHFTLKTDPLKREDLDEFVACYHGLNAAGKNPPSVPL